MAGRHKSILIIPPGKGRVRFLRIRPFAAVLAAVLIAAGITGFFIPLSSFSPDAMEQNRRRNLIRQNRILSLRITEMRKMLREVDAGVKRLDERKQNVRPLAGIARVRDTLERQPRIDIKRLDRLMAHVAADEELYRKFATADRSGRFIFDDLPVMNPVAGLNMITAGFGEMTDPFTGTLKFHYGIDFAAKRETPVLASADGSVVQCESSERWGRRIRIRHADGFSTVYAHLGTVAVSHGQRVKRGQLIATVGVSGITTGPHLHYEIWRNDKPVNPELYLFPEPEILALSETGGHL
jgi:murein DD-endopeptidase MepM/ murein hydrolase activator NlpD